MTADRPATEPRTLPCGCVVDDYQLLMSCSEAHSPYSTAAAQGAAPLGRSSDPEPAPCRHDAKWIADFTDWVIRAHEQQRAVPALQATGEPPSDRITITPDIEGDARRISESLNDMLRGAGATGEGERHE